MESIKDIGIELKGKKKRLIKVRVIAITEAVFGKKRYITIQALTDEGKLRAGLKLTFTDSKGQYDWLNEGDEAWICDNRVILGRVS